MFWFFFYYFHLIRAVYFTELIAKRSDLDFFFILEINMLLYCWEKVKMSEYRCLGGVEKVGWQADLL